MGFLRLRLCDRGQELGFPELKGAALVRCPAPPPLPHSPAPCNLPRVLSTVCVGTERKERKERKGAGVLMGGL
jgi:hypothetical protein